MKDLIGKLVRKKDLYSASTSPSSRYSKLSYDDESSHYSKHEIKRGYVPITVGKYEKEEERFMVPTKLIKHPSIVALLQLSANEFGYHQEGVLHIPCEPNLFRKTLDTISCKRK
ncbi:hypothetical protein RND81_03G195200 [Saponaria officinalis]|uniref:Uncharacterized protein n=1 Tax=Saponaria officinalis TaxID=3572 RepID=A0AAW1MBV5_SAPOF